MARPARRADVEIPKPALKLIEWLVGDGCRDLDDAELIAALGARLVRLGVPVDRLTLHLPTLHPQIFRRSVAWAPAEPVEIRDRESGGVEAEAFNKGPLAEAIAAGHLTVFNVERNEAWLDCDLFRNRALSAFILVPLASASGSVSVIGFATKRRQGFGDAARAAIEAIAPALARVVELRALRRAAA